jgi:glutamate dehydrogenase
MLVNVPHTQDSTPEELLHAYFRHIAPEDLADRVPDDLAGALASHRRLAARRLPGEACVKVSTPSVSANGWEAHGHSIVEVVTDDMPFLVDSVLMELNRQDHDVHLVVHPRFDVRRSGSGELEGVVPADERSPAPEGQLRESWMHMEIGRLGDREAGAALEAALRSVLGDVRAAVEDWAAMRERVDAIVSDVRSGDLPLPAAEVEQGCGLLSWLAADHFTFLGYREYALGADDVLRPVAGTGLGILRDQAVGGDAAGSLPPLPEFVRTRAREKALLVLAKANSRATVHRPTYLDYVGVKTFGADGEVTGERRFLGLWSSAAYTESLRRIPLLAQKADGVLAEAGLDARSHAGKALLDILEGYPRDELLTAPVKELATVAEAVLQARERRRLRLFVRPDPYRRYLTCLVYLPRDRYNTSVRERFARILREQLQGASVEFTARVGDSPLAQIHFVVRPPAGEGIPAVDVGALERQLIEAARSWSDDFVNAVSAEFGEAEAARLLRAYRGAFPPAYVEDFSPRAAAADVRRIEAIVGDEGVDIAISDRVDAPPDEVRLTVYRVGSPLTLTAVLPMLASFGVEVVDERPHELVGLDRPTWIYEFGLRAPAPVGEEERAPLEEALRAIWAGACEVDGFNGLVLDPGLRWRQVVVLRAYARYLRQTGTPFSLESIEGALRENVELTRLLVELFEARFDPDRAAGATPTEEAIADRIADGLDDVVRLDHDRILRSYLGLIRATLRTNHFVLADGRHRPYLSVKLDPTAVPDLPEPRPRFEIFVHSPRVEGVHLRFGPVARGGLRWSDRRDDFRTEVLGLVKAQMVKNTVIVPVGAKGGFYAKQLPDPSDREAWLAEGIACYRTFISGLLDLTDNLVGGEVVPPPRVVRHDEDDSYLVVAADKGTATFSDIANEVAAGYGFWLGDAFASAGRSATTTRRWASPRGARGCRCSATSARWASTASARSSPVAGIGDMSGDVFGNGLLSSPSTRLVAAFDHRDIFIDPDPDAATSYAERARLFALPRSSGRTTTVRS